MGAGGHEGGKGPPFLGVPPTPSRKPGWACGMEQLRTKDTQRMCDCVSLIIVLMLAHVDLLF